MIDSLIAEEPYKSIKDYIRDWIYPDIQFVNVIREILSSGDANELIIPPESNLNLYRGLNAVTNEMMSKILGTDSFPKSGRLDYDGFIRPKGKNTLMSFSRDNKVVESDFAWARMHERYAVMFCANSSDNPGIFLDLENFYKFGDLKRFKVEKEVVALGPVKFRTVWWEGVTEDGVLALIKTT